jgi:hypothetical protein
MKMSPDITMCLEKKCPIKRKCYRHIAKPDKWQSYFVEVHFEKGLGKSGKCEYFWDVTKEGDPVPYCTDCGAIEPEEIEEEEDE